MCELILRFKSRVYFCVIKVEANAKAQENEF